MLVAGTLTGAPPAYLQVRQSRLKGATPVYETVRSVDESSLVQGAEVFHDSLVANLPA